MWLDGFAELLKSEGQKGGPNYSLQIIDRLTDIEVKIRLMDLSANEVKLREGESPVYSAIPPKTIAQS